MAIVRAGPLVQAISGSLSSIVFANARAALVVRNRPLKINQQTNFQITQRAKYSFVVASWKTLTDLQKTGWKNLAGQVPTANALGQRRALSAFQLFVKFNLLIPDPETNLIDDPPLSIRTAPPTSITWIPHENEPYYFEAELPYDDPDSYVLVYCARSFSPVSPKFWSNFRHAGTLKPIPIPRDIHNEVDSKIGPLKEGEQTALKIRTWRTDRLPSAPSTTEACVLSEGLYPTSAVWRAVPKVLNVYFNNPLDGNPVLGLNWNVKHDLVNYQMSSFSPDPDKLILYNPVETPCWPPWGISFNNTADDVKTPSGVICQSFSRFPFTVGP